MDWKKIKRDYITDPDSSYRKLSSKYGVSVKEICNHGRAEGWPEQRKQHMNNLSTKTLEKIVEKESNFVAEQMARIDQAVEIAIGKAMEALLEIDPQDTQRHRQLVQNIKDLREMLRVDDGAVHQEITIKMEDDVKDWSK